MDGSLYEIYVPGNRVETLAEDLDDRQYAISEDGKRVAYQTADSVESASQVIVKDLESGEEYEVSAGEDECVLPLGFVDDDFVCGCARHEDIGTTISGDQAVAMCRVEIRNPENEVLKTYDPGENYVLDADTASGMITLHRAKKNGSIYTEISADYIASSEEAEESNITPETYVTELKGTQMRLTYVDGIQEKSAKVLKPKQVLENDPALPEFEGSEKEDRYYVYGLGRLQGIYGNAGAAIRRADSVSGVVIASNGQYVWERGNRYLSYLISGQEELLSSLVSRLMAGTPAVETADEVSGGRSVELSDCSLEQTLYLVNKGTPVIGVRAGQSPVLLIGYTENEATYVDVESGQQQTVPREQMEQMMTGEGCVYIGYLPPVQ